MKVSKSGKPLLEKGEVRVGNYFVKTEKEHFKVADLNSVFTLRISRETAVGMWVSNMLSQGDGGVRSLHVYFATLWSALSPAPDDTYISDLISAATGCLERHRDWYGIKDAVSDDEDAKVVDEEREKAEFIEEVKNVEAVS